ncbi:MAG: hypothetical protein ACYDHN_11760 [Solirubrobacteraceae bacterium]
MGVATSLRRRYVVIGLLGALAAGSLVGAPLSAATGKVDVSFAIAAHRSAKGNDVVRLTNHEHRCVGYEFRSYETSEGDEVLAGKSARFEVDISQEHKPAIMRFYRCGHFSATLATVHYMFVRGYSYGTGPQGH